jgi:rhodanese-related sulfurtransferase/DNA-binding transcriptional ArsR family regulator
MTSRRSVKDILYEQVGRLAKSIANAKRLELVELLCQSPKAVETLAGEAGISVKLASAHLKELRLAHVVEADRQGRQVIYRISCPEVAGLLVSIRALAADRLIELRHSMQHLSAQAAHWTDRDSETLSRKAGRGEISVLDVRPAAEYRQRHIAFARSIPLPELSSRLHELPQDKPVVAYCRGPFCQMAVEAVQLLTHAGFEAYLWQEGAANWIAHDTPDLTPARREETGLHLQR